jgi:hypothetical protein
MPRALIVENEMADASKTTLKARTDAHSDVADTPPARARQTEMVERQLGNLLVQRLREKKSEGVTFSNFQEEWHTTDEGLVLELSVDLETLAEA